nr:haloacid dehalogenase-like hydrolase [Saprospiraceae bacterium]
IASPNKSIAIFDLDGTITSKDTFLEFIRMTHGSIRLYAGFLLNGLSMAKYFLKRIDNQTFKEIIFGHFYKGYKEADLRALGVKFSENILPTICFPKALERLKYHQENNHEIVILTASSSIWLGDWCHQNNFTLIGTEYEVHKGKITGKIAGKNCYGEEKVQRLLAKFQLQDYTKSFGYGDSKADQYFLDIMDEGYLNKFK